MLNVPATHFTDAIPAFFVPVFVTKAFAAAGELPFFDKTAKQDKNRLMVESRSRALFLFCLRYRFKARAGSCDAYTHAHVRTPLLADTRAVRAFPRTCCGVLVWACARSSPAACCTERQKCPLESDCTRRCAAHCSPMCWRAVRILLLAGASHFERRS